MRTRRVVVVIDSGAPLDTIETETHAWQQWVERERPDVSTGIVLFGRKASWLPSSASRIFGSSSLAAVGRAERPDLRAALTAASMGPKAHALLTVLAREPASDWRTDLDASAFPFRACVSWSSSPVAAVGSGYLGANFRSDHFGLALRWLTSELCDRSYWCDCGRILVYGDPDASCECGRRAPIPPRLRIRGQVVLLLPGARLYPHHLGRPLDFERPLAVLDRLSPKDGSLTIEGVSAQIRTTPPRHGSPHVGRFRAPPIVARTDRCAACGGELVSPVGHQPPDPRRFCAPCIAAPHRCDFCGVPLSATVRTAWPDGRTACQECWNTAVTEITELHTLAKCSRAWLSRRLQMNVAMCPIHFEHAAAIAGMHGREFQPSSRHVARPIGFFRAPIDGAPSAIFVEHGTPLCILYGVLTHELTHLWQWDHWPRQVARTLSEGLAMWVEYHALLDAGAIHAARHSELYDDPVYGLGFRIALAVETELGFDQVKSRLCDVASASVSGVG